MRFGMKLYRGAATSLLLLTSLLYVGAIDSSAQTINARIKGVVTDPTGAVVPSIAVVATNTQTGVKFNTTSNSDGTYTFPQLPIGTYSIKVAASGFKGFEATGIALNIDQEYDEPIKLQLGAATDIVSVKADAVQVNTTDMQLSNIVDAHQITELPLIGRGFTGLEAILPGVQASSDRFGSFSVNGSQTQQSSYIINGADSNDLPLNTVAISPNIDALAQFNLITGPMNAEYDRNGGGIVNTAIKQGTNGFHGDVFEFYRDTFLNTNNFYQKSFDPNTGARTDKVAKFHQNIFGGTLGGRVLRDKLFFFGAYQGIRQKVPETGGSVFTFTANQLTGNFAGSTISSNVIPGTIKIPGCVSGVQTFASCFAGNTVPTAAFNPISVALVNKYVPPPNNGYNNYVFNPTVNTSADQEIGRVDFNPTSKDQIYFVGIFQKTVASETLPFTGASLPGFGDMNTTNIHQFSTGYTRQIGATLVNDFELHYTRFNFDAVEPQTVVAPSTFGFSINPQNTAAESLPTISIAQSGGGKGPGFTLGFSTNGPQPRIDSVYQADETISKQYGHHNIKFGYDGRKYTVRNPFYARNNGSFGFNNGHGDSSGDAGLDFLLGIPASYSQGSGARIDAYAFLNYFFAQDTWKATNALTLSYGVGWQIDTQLHNRQYNGEGISCYIPGQQSSVFTSAPKGLNYPGDPGCNDASGAKTKYGDFGPRLGFAYAPDFGFLSAGASKKLSIRGGYGIYYNRSEEETSLQNLGVAPFGQNSNGAVDYGATNPSFANPYIDLNTGAVNANKFPFIPPAAGTSPSFKAYEPMFLSQVSPSFRSPYSENYQLTVEREFPGQTVARASYVGTLGRHNQITYEGNPITQAGHDACLADPVCSSLSVRGLQAQRYPTHTQYGFPDLNLATASSPAGRNDFNGIGIIATSGTSNYNSLQLSVDKGLTHGLQMQASYTYAHGLDDGSSFENSGFGGARGYNQYQKGLNYGNSSYDARHRFVLAPIYVVTYKHGTNAFNPINLALSGWQISGISTFATGFPYDVNTSVGSLSLYCGTSVSYYACPDNPNQVAPLVTGNPRNKFNGGQTAWFNPASFATEAVGTFGNVSRYKYHGPGINNTNLILAKNFNVTSDGTYYIQLRMESDNVFNHTQFSNPTANISSGLFGQITSAAAARQTQLAAKIYF